MHLAWPGRLARKIGCTRVLKNSKSSDDADADGAAAGCWPAGPANDRIAKTKVINTGPPRRQRSTRGADYTPNLPFASFFGPGRRQHASQAVVALVACILEQFAARTLPVDHRGPGFRPHRGVVHSERVLQRVVGRAPEALGEVQVFIREHEVPTKRIALWIEVRGLDHEGIAFPSSA